MQVKKCLFDRGLKEVSISIIMGEVAYKGIFYDFESEEKFNALVQKIRGRCTKEENGCEIWPGEINNKDPRFTDRDSKPAYVSLPRLIFQAANPDFVLPDAPYKIVRSCNNDRCISPDHIQVSERVLWDTDAILKRLNAGCSRSSPSHGFEKGCLLWYKCTVPEGYGSINIDRKSRRVHVVALLIHEGLTEPPMGPDGKPLMVRHMCANRNCCEASHLEWGTAKQNGEDMVRDGKSGAGEDSPLAQMSNETASTIKLSWRPRNDPEYMTQVERAKKFGVTVNVVNSIDCGATWKHIPGPPNKPEKKVTEQTLLTRDDLDDAIMNTLVSRINAKVKITPDISKDPDIKTPCHIFNGADSQGYGIIGYKNLALRVHIVVCEHKMKQKTPDGLIVRHICGNKKCVATDHLKFGTRSENLADAIKHGDLIHKFSIDEVQRIRKIPITDTKAIKKEADDYDVRYDYIQGIINKRIYASVK